MKNNNQLNSENQNANEIRKEYFLNWFTMRGLKIVEYQQNILSNKLTFNGEPMVLAVSPSGGKTAMSIAAIDRYCLDNPTHKVLVLTHGQTVLRSQYATNLKEYYPAFNWTTIDWKIQSDFKIPQIKSNELISSGVQVFVALPQSIHRQVLPHFDFIVVDEAHQYYFANMVQSIIKKNGQAHQLLLTGTPSPFIKRHLKIIPVSLEVLYDNGMISDPIIELASSTYNFTQKDYNQQYELKDKVRISKQETTTTLEMLLQKLATRTKIDNSNWNETFRFLSKTMIVCRNQDQAKNVFSFFQNEKVNVALSISDTDTDSTEITRFINNKDCFVLIVVFRGILGFNYPELINIIDMSCSQNLDKIFQLLCRVIRISKMSQQKLFIKVVPRNLSEHFKYLMTGVLCLTKQEYYSKFNGRNFCEMDIPVIVTHEKQQNKEGNCIKTKNNLEIRPIEFYDLPAISFFKSLTNNNTKILNLYATITLGKVLNTRVILYGQPINEVFDQIHKEFVKNNCKRVEQLHKCYPKGYTYLKRHNLVNEFMATYEITSLHWKNGSKDETFDFIYKAYQTNNCKSMNDLRNCFLKGYIYLYKNKLYKEFMKRYSIMSKYIKWESIGKEKSFQYIYSKYKEYNCKSINDLHKVFQYGYVYLQTRKYLSEFTTTYGIKYFQFNSKDNHISFQKLSKEESFDLIYREFMIRKCRNMTGLTKNFSKGYYYLNNKKLVNEFTLKYNIPYNINYISKRIVKG